MFFCYSVFKKQNKILLLTQRNAYVDELNPDGSCYSLLATKNLKKLWLKLFLSR